jgi:glutamate-1-semialdehyde aminotransferase
MFTASLAVVRSKAWVVLWELEANPWRVCTFAQPPFVAAGQFEKLHDAGVHRLVDVAEQVRWTWCGHNGDQIIAFVIHTLTEAN